MSEQTTLEWCKEFMENDYQDYQSIRNLLWAAKKAIERTEELIVIAETDPPDYAWGLELVKERAVYQTFVAWAENKLKE